MSKIVHIASSSPVPVMDRSDIFCTFSSFFFWPPPYLFQADLAGGQQSGAKQHYPAVHNLQRLTNENVNSTVFYTLSGNILAYS